MATSTLRFYLTDTATPYTPSSIHGAFEDKTTATVIKKLDTAKGTTVASSAVAEAVNTTNYDVFLGRWVSAALTVATTIPTATEISYCIGTQTSNTASGASLYFNIWVTAGDSNTERGVAVADTAIGDAMSATAEGQGNTVTTTGSVSASVNDRIVVEVGYRDTDTATTSYTSTMWYGGAGANATDTGDETTQASWIDIPFTNASPTTALGTPADDATGISVTPALKMTGTDVRGMFTASDEVEYEVQVSTSSSFNETIGIDTSNKSSAATSTTTNTLSWSHTVASGLVNSLLIVAIGNGDAKVVSGNITYGGVNLTKIDAYTPGVDAHTELWYLKSPTAGTGTVALTLDGNALSIDGIAITFTNVNQNTPIRGYAHNGNVAGGPTVNVTSATGDLVIDVVKTQSSASTLTVGASQIEEKKKQGNWGWTAVSSEAGSGTVTMSWTEGAYDSFWSQIGASIIPAPLLDILSSTDDDANWAGTGAPNPFPSGNEITYTVPVASALAAGIKHYWRVRAIDPLGSNTWGAWGPGAHTGYSEFTTTSGNAQINVDDDINVSENITSWKSNQQIDVFDSVNISENIVIFRTSHNVNVFDPVNISENITTLRSSHNIDVFDSITTAETITSKSGPLYTSVGDDVNVSEDTTLKIPSGNTSVFDNINVSENIGSKVNFWPINVFDTVNISEYITSTIPSGSANVFDNINVSENIGSKVNFWPINVFDSVTVSEDATSKIPSGSANVFDNINVSENIGSKVNFWPINVFDTVNISEGITSTSGPLRISVDDDIEISEDITGTSGPLRLNVYDGIKINEDIISELDSYNIEISDSVNVSEEIIAEAITPLPEFSEVEVYDDITVSEDSPVFLPDLTLEVSDDVTVSEDIINWVSAQIVDVFDNIIVTEDITIFQSNLIVSVNDNIAVSENISSAVNFRKVSVSDWVAVTENPFIDFYLINRDDGTALNYSVDSDKKGQSFIGDGGVLDRLLVYMSKSGSPTGDIVAKIYNHSGTYGVSSVPTGAALATSGIVDASTLGSSNTPITFIFTGVNKITLTNEVKYVFSVECVQSGVALATDHTTLLHAGNAWHYAFGSFSALPTYEVIFYLFKDTDEYIHIEPKLISVGDDINISEDITTWKPVFHINVSDSIEVSEDTEVGIVPPLEIDVYDPVTVQDVLVWFPDTIYVREYIAVEITTFVPELEVNVYDDISVGENLGQAIDFWEISVFDDLTISEGITFLTTELFIDVFDLVNISENVTYETVSSLTYYDIEVSDNITINENLSQVTENRTFYSTISGNNYYFRVVTNTVEIMTTGKLFDTYEPVAGHYIGLMTSPEGFVIDTDPFGGNINKQVYVFTFSGTLTHAELAVKQWMGSWQTLTRAGEVLLQINVYDDVQVTEGITSTVNFLEINVSDSINVSENFGGGTNILGLDVFDEIEVSENITVLLPTLCINVSDSVTVSENFPISLPTITLVVFDSIAVSEDVVARSYPLYLDIFDSLTISEGIITGTTPKTINVFDSINVSEDPVVDISGFMIIVSDGIKVSEDVVVYIPTLHLDISDSVTVTGNITVLEKNLILNVYDSVNVSEGVSSIVPFGSVDIFDSVKVSEDITFTSLFPINISDNVFVSENFPLYINNLSISNYDLITVSEDINVYLTELFLSVFDSIVLTDGVLAQQFLDKWLLEGKIPSMWTDKVHSAHGWTNKSNAVNPWTIESRPTPGWTEVLSPPEALDVAWVVKGKTEPTYGHVVRSASNPSTITDSINISEYIRVDTGYPLNVYDSATISEGITSKVPLILINIFDNIKVSQSTTLTRV